MRRSLGHLQHRENGAARKFSDQAIETALALRLVFHLPLRQAEGFLRSVLSLMALELDAPDHTTLSRRSQQLNIDLRLVATKGPIHLIIDSTGRSIIGEGEWAAVKHGGRGSTRCESHRSAIDWLRSARQSPLRSAMDEDPWGSEEPLSYF